MALNDNHRRAIASGFGAIDKTLREIEANIASSSASPFAKYAVDLTAIEQRTLLDHVSRARTQMVEGLRALGVELGRERASIRGPVQIGMTFAVITVDDLAPSRLRGYGVVDDGSRVVLERMLADLARTLRTLGAYVSRDAALDVSARLGVVDDAPIDLAFVRTLDDVITRRGLVELRASLVAIVERLETRTFDVAIFGRVSSGKSSLLNAVLARPLLPVGVTPVTAFPTRITSGDAENAVVSFARSGDETIPLERLGEFVTEQHNAENAKGVTRIVARIRSHLLHDAITLVDTPGVGSLARMGARETYAYLPSCDLGVLVIDGSSSPGADDFALLARLLDSGIDAKVVLSKADLSSEVDRAQLGAYVEEAISRELGVRLSPVWVSSVGTRTTAHEWFTREIAPLAASGRALADASLRRKIRRLRDEVVGALRADATAHVAEPDVSKIDALGADAERLVTASESRLETICSGARDLAPRIVREGAVRLAERAPDETPSACLESVVASCVEEIRVHLRDELGSTRAALERALEEIAVCVGDHGSAPELRVDFLSMPAPTLPAALRTFSFDAKRWPAPMRAGRISSRLVDDAGAPTIRMLSDFGVALRAWARGAVARLGEQFTAHADPLRARARRLAPHEARETDVSLAEDLRALAIVGDESGHSA